jgi:hypothetical protein
MTPARHPSMLPSNTNRTYAGTRIFSGPSTFHRHH